ncbi:MAG TPA: RNA polymerase sigma-70 factor [Pseudolysinimonas sp.]|nr:RNA polymerase sigma-70 factor [Pseudolysinimonas sp.]
MDAALETFQAVRPRMFGIAYRMLGTVAEAEDVVQDAWVRWQGTDRSAVREPAAFLATTVTRLAINALDSARARRETYIGPWLPEPVVTTDDPTLGAERAEAMSLAVLLLLERLTPAERAAFVLHEAFDYPYRQIAEVLETSEANARQLASRARTHLDRERATEVSPTEKRRLLDAFTAAALNGDLDALEAVLAEDAVALSDGGGVVRAARKPVVGRARVAQFLLGILEKFTAGVESHPAMINGEPGFIGVRDGAPMAAWTFEVGADGVQRFLNVMNPAKLSRIAVPSGHS